MRRARLSRSAARGSSARPSPLRPDGHDQRDLCQRLKLLAFAVKAAGDTLGSVRISDCSVFGQTAQPLSRHFRCVVAGGVYVAHHGVEAAQGGLPQECGIPLDRGHGGRHRHELDCRPT